MLSEAKHLLLSACDKSKSFASLRMTIQGPKQNLGFFNTP
jgi:hypothetical protein